jgi:hypothetical protein
MAGFPSPLGRQSFGGFDGGGGGGGGVTRRLENGIQEGRLPQSGTSRVQRVALRAGRWLQAHRLHVGGRGSLSTDVGRGDGRAGGGRG